MVVDGKGAPGFLKGSGDLDLVAEGESTAVNYTGDVQIGGTIASVGQRIDPGYGKNDGRAVLHCFRRRGKNRSR